MMKFFRKYNKHLLAVFMSLLLVIWLGGSALTSMVRRDPGKSVIGTAISGPITQGDFARVQNDASLLAQLGISWRQAFRNPNAASNDQIDTLEWILLEREAKRMGLRVSIAEAKSALAPTPRQEDRINALASGRYDIPVETIYEAAARTIAVYQMRSLFMEGLEIPEPQLRRLAMNTMERAEVEAVTFPAESYAAPEETFTEAELQAQFNAYKDKPTGGTGLNFSYYIDPRVKLDYFKIDPKVIQAELAGDDKVYERRAYGYWKLNKNTDWHFRRTPEEMKALREKAKADAGTNGATPPPDPSPFYESFAEARLKAIEAVKQQDAVGDAARIANALARAVAEPWIAVPQLPTEYQPAPASVTAKDYYEQVAAELPETLKFPGVPEVGHLGWITARELANTESIGTAQLILPENRSISIAQLAFNVEGFAAIPEDQPHDRDLYLSKYQSLTKSLKAGDGSFYIFRVTATQEGHAPANLEEVADRVADDLRLLHGMKRAKAAAEAFAAHVGTSGLKTALEADAETYAKITPDRGGYVDIPDVVRDSSKLSGRKNFVPALGEVTDEFITQAFELAAHPEADKVAVVELPALAQVAVMKGKKLTHFYAEDYAQRRPLLKKLLAQQTASAIINDWLNPKSIRERNGYKPNRPNRGG